jgi:hypothetical protein
MKQKLFLLSLLLLAISCTKSKESNKICFTRTSTALNIRNTTSKTIYFAAFGQKILSLIDWAPDCSNNEVSSNSSVNKKLSTLPGYSDDDMLVVYWWECTGSNPGEIHSVLLNEYEKECR